MIPFGEWLPDQPNTACNTATNCIAHANSYGQARSLVAVSDALDGDCLGSFWMAEDGGTIRNFAGDATDLYLLSAGAFSKVSKSGGYSSGGWEFVKFGERIIAGGGGVDTQYYDAGTSSLFADLTGAPQAKHWAIVGDFVVAGNLTNDTNKIKWSGYNNSELWTPSVATQSDEQELFGKGGMIQRIVPGKYGVIFQEHSIWRMDYAGPPTIFSINEVERGRGTPAGGSVCWSGNRVYYLGHDGFYAFNGEFSEPIGAEKIDRYVSRNIDRSKYEQISSAVDRQNKLVFWSLPFISGGKVILAYSWAIGRWSLINIDCDCLGEYASPGYTLDELDTVLTDIDTDSISVDSTAYQGGAISISAYKDKKLSTFTGSALTAEIETAELSGRQMINRVRPHVEGASNISLCVGTRNKETDSTTFGPLKSPTSIGDFTHRSNGRYTKFKVRIEDGFNHASGVEIVAGRQGGFR